MLEQDFEDASRRTRLANERTYLAWLRSALTSLAVAVGAGKIVPGVADVTAWPFELLGAGFAAFALVFTAIGTYRYVKVEEAIVAQGFVPLGWAEAVLIAVGAAFLGVATLVLVFVH